MADLLQGTLDLLILKTLSVSSDHGYGIVRRIRRGSGDVLEVEEGSLYPALHRLEKKGLLESEWQRSETNRRAKVYSLTGAGRKRLADESERWERLSGAVGKVLGATRVAGGMA